MPADPAHVPVQPAPTAPTAFVGWTGSGPVDTPVPVRGVEDYRATFGTTDEPSPLDRAVGLFFANGGTDAVVVRAAGPGADQVVPPGRSGGLGALTGRFSVLVLPGLTSSHSRAVGHALARCAQERAVLLLDLPHEADARAAALEADRVGGARDRVAVYHPWVVVSAGGTGSGPSGGTALVPSSGAVAGVIASTDAARGVARTPMGGETELRAVEGLGADLTAEEAELLAAHGVNALRSLPDRRRVVWGGRLLGATGSAGPSARFLAVRRLTDHVLESLERGMAFVADRRTDPGLADLLQRRAEDFLTDLWRGGALAGETPREAFFARCDRTTTSAADLAAGRMVLLLGLATTRPAEFEVHELVLETSTARGPDVLDAPRALASATALARERGTVVRREHLAPLVSGSAEETERRLSEVFDSAAHARTVLLLQEADALFARTDDARTQQRGREVARLLDRLSHRTGVPYVLAGTR